MHRCPSLLGCSLTLALEVTAEIAGMSSTALITSSQRRQSMFWRNAPPFKSSFSWLKTTFLCGLVRLCPSARCCSGWNTLARRAPLRESSCAWSQGTESPTHVISFRASECALDLSCAVLCGVNVLSEVASKARMQPTVGLFSCRLI